MVNRTILHGRLVKDVEVKEVGGFSMTEFTVAWSDKYKDIEKKCFLRCKAWRSNADFLKKYFIKGQELIVEGQMLTEEWEKDGQKQSRTVLNVEKIHFCGSKNANGNVAQAQSDDSFMSIPDTDAEEIPFS